MTGKQLVSLMFYFRKWRRHSGHHGHDLQEATSSQGDMEDGGSEDSLSQQPTRAGHFSQDIFSQDISSQDIVSNQASQPDSDSGDQSSGPPSSPGLPHQHPDPDPDPWYPFRSRVHCQLVLLFMGSHRKNIDLITFQAFMSVLKVECLMFILIFNKNKLP